MKLVWMVIALVGCVDSTVVRCPDDRVCPPDTVCRVMPPSAGSASPGEVCASRDELAACDGVTDGGACGSAGICRGGVCVPSVCGNGYLDPGEACDDGNQADAGSDGQPDGCSANCLSTQVCGNGVVDFINREECDDGGSAGGAGISHDGCSSNCKLEKLAWSSATSATQVVPTPAMAGASIAFDPVRRRLVMFGGLDANDNPTDNMYEYDGSNWYALTPSVRPPARSNGSMAYDPEVGATILFGGESNNDLWAWDGTQWTELSDGGGSDVPPVRVNAGMVYDPLKKQLVLFGGSYGLAGHSRRADTWTWSSAGSGSAGTWTQVSDPDAQIGSNAPDVDYFVFFKVEMAADYGTGNVMVYSNGSNAAWPTSHTPEENETWVWSGANWSDQGKVGWLTNAGPRVNTTVAYDPVNHQIALFGGNLSGGPALNDMVEWTGSAWRQVSAGGTGPNLPPGSEDFQTMITDPVGGAMYLYEVDTQSSSTTAGSASLWRWNGSAWSLASSTSTPIPTPPTPKEFAEQAFSYDPLRAETLVFGGYGSTNVPSNATWIWNGAWTSQTSAAAPSPRLGASMAYDPVHDARVLFGGISSVSYSGTTQIDGTLYADTWVWQGSAWAPGATNGPSPRYSSGMAFDGQDIILFGGMVHGSGSGDPGIGDTWKWSWNGTAGSWVQQSGTGPSPRGDFAMAEDLLRQQIVLFGGSPFENALDDTPYNDTWIWTSGAGWTQAHPAHSPTARWRPRLVWYPTYRRLVLVGGETEGGTAIDLWAWDGNDWSQIGALPFPMDNPVVTPALDGAGVYVITSSMGATLLTTPTELSWSATEATSYELCGTSGNVDADGDGLSGCNDPDCWYLCSPEITPGGSGSTAASPYCPLYETCVSDPWECACPSVCGDLICGSDETAATCPIDCP